MLYLSLILFVTAIYVRPGELLPALAELPVVQILSAVAGLCAAVSLILEPRRFWDRPADKCVLGLWAVATVSNVVWGWVGGGIMAFNQFSTLAFSYFLVRLSVRTRQHIVGLIYVLVALNLFLAVSGIRQYRATAPVAAMEAYGESAAAPDAPTDDEDREAEQRRIRGTGIFNDPNDLAMTMVLAVPLVIAIGSSGATFAKIAAAIPFGVLVTAIALTNSRGGMLGLIAVICSYTYSVRRKLTIAVAVVALAVAAVAGPSRMSEMDSDEESAQGRIQAWAAGIEMLKMNPVSGVGFGQFTEYNELVAHNSFVHTFAELGLLGAFLLVGLFYSFFAGLGPVSGALAGDPRWTRAVRSSGIGFVVCGWFLSRQYTPILYLLMGLGASCAAAGASPVEDRWRSTRNIGMLTIGGVMLTYVAVRVLAIWSR